MPGNKNPSPSALAAFNAVILAVISATGSLLLAPFWLSALITFVVVFLIAYSLFLYSLQKFIYRKIKLIYKFIYQTKATKQEEFFNKEILPQKSLEEAGLDVERWAAQKREEIENLQRNEKFRKEFLLNLSHELKTPAFAIEGYIHTLLDGAVEDQQVNKRFLQHAAKNVSRLNNLINDLDEISSMESGEMKLSSQAFVIQELMKDVFDTLSFKAKEKNISFSIKKGCEAPLKVYADKEKIQRVLINLVDNAIKYGKPGGHVIASFYDLDGKKALTEISDNGIGITEEHLPRVFERFYRVDKARVRKDGGTGLGLAIVKHLVEAHDQTINVRSKPKVGSTFGFTLRQAQGDLRQDE